MAFGGLGWLTFLSPSLAHELSPFNMLPGILGELSLDPELTLGTEMLAKATLAQVVR